MTDSDTRTLRSYLTYLELSLRNAKEARDMYDADKAAACRAGEEYNAQHAQNMKQWAYGKVCALEVAISEFKELFAEELGGEEGEC